MNKADLVAAMAEKAGVSKKDAEASLKAFTDVVAEVVKERREDPVSWIRYFRGI